ncbi:hypothetical protein Tco_1311564 [Tanacetum coccineum]
MMNTHTLEWSIGWENEKFFVSPTLKITDLSSCLKVICSSCTSIKALPVLKNGLPKINRTLGFGIIVNYTKSGWKVEGSTFTKLLSAMPGGSGDRIDGYGKVVLALHETRSSIGTIGGFLGRSLGPSYETPLLVVIAFNSPFGLAMVLLGREPELEVEACHSHGFGFGSTILIVGLAVVLHGRKTGWSDLVASGGRTVNRNSLVEIGLQLLRRDIFLVDVISVNCCLSVAGQYRIMGGAPPAATSWSTSPEVERSYHLFAYNGVAFGSDNFGLTLDESCAISGHFCQSLPLRREFKES